MATRRNQLNVQAKDLPLVSGVTNSASFRPGENSATSGAGICGSNGTATASARQPATRPSPARRRKRTNLLCGIATDSSRGFHGTWRPSCVKMCRTLQDLGRIGQELRFHEIPAHHYHSHHHRDYFLRFADGMAASSEDAA